MSKEKRGPGRPRKHGAYSINIRDDELKNHPRIRQYLEETRQGLIRDVSGSEENLSEQQRILIDRIISKLSIMRLIEVYIEKYGAFRQDRFKKDKVLELAPALGQNYLAFSNSVDRALKILGIEKKKAEDVMDLDEYIRKRDAAEQGSQGDKKGNR
jgi:hypothetical protein